MMLYEVKKKFLDLFRACLLHTYLLKNYLLSIYIQGLGRILKYKLKTKFIIT